MIYTFLPVLCLAFWWLGVARGIRKKDKETSLTTYKADPRSFYPSFFFELKSNAVAEMEKRVEASTVINRGTSATSIARSVDELVDLYGDAIESFEIKELKERIALCHKAIKLEKESFLTDSGPEAAEFTMNRQNAATEYILTGITIPMLIGAINIEASNANEFIEAVSNKPALSIIFEVFICVFAYRVFKYYWNKRSKLNDTKRVILYNKAELMLCAFESAVERKK